MRLQEHRRTKLSLKMLVHDFSKDPVFAGRPKSLARVVAAQKRYLDVLGNQSEELVDISIDPMLKAFVKALGLYDVYASSLGMDGVDTK